MYSDYIPWSHTDLVPGWGQFCASTNSYNISDCIPVIDGHQKTKYWMGNWIECSKQSEVDRNFDRKEAEITHLDLLHILNELTKFDRFHWKILLPYRAYPMELQRWKMQLSWIRSVLLYAHFFFHFLHFVFLQSMIQNYEVSVTDEEGIQWELGMKYMEWTELWYFENEIAKPSQITFVTMASNMT